MILGIGIGIQFTSGSGAQSLTSQLLSALEGRSTYYENGDGATVILEQFENCTS